MILKFEEQIDGIFINNEVLETDKEVTLFDPKETPELLTTYGDEFKKYYEMYENKTGIRKKKIKAEELFYLISKVRLETGNLYILFSDNVNSNKPFKEPITQSNLCLKGDTKVQIKNQTKDGIKEIKDVKVGDFVKSYNTKTKKIEYKKVTASAMTNPKTKVMKITDEKTGKYIICTPDHKVWTENRGYVEAKNLKETDILNIKNYKTKTLLKIEYLEEEIAVYDITVEDNHNFFANDILVHNCTEIVLPTKPSYLKEQKMVKENFKNYTLKEEIEPGEIALCNLSSINVVEWAELSEERKQRVSYNLLRSHDNLIEYAFYPVKEGEFHNKTYRPIGIGVSNMAYYFAKNKKSPEDLKKLFKAQFDIMEDVYYHLYSSAIKLAKERGKFENFSKTKWSEGWLPIDSDLSIFNKFADESQKLRWENLRKDIKKFGLRFSTIGAVAPTACQTKDSEIVTENGIESIQTILENNKIDFEKLEEIGIPQWLELKNSFKVQTRFGLKEVERIWFNGKVPVREIEFEDGKKYKFSYNHQLLVKFEDGKEKWVQVKDLKENMEIVDLNLK